MSSVHFDSIPSQIASHPLVQTALWLGRVITLWVYDGAEKLHTFIKKIFNDLGVMASAVCATARVAFSCGPIKVVQVTSDNQATYSQRVQALEKKATYPLGQDSFQIDHGKNYFAFFERLGELHYYVAQEKEKVVGVGAGVLRSIPVQKDKPLQKCWYLCDLKIDPEYRGRHIPMYIFAKGAWKAFFSTRGYAISMNPKDGENRIVRMFKNFSWVKVDAPKQLAIFSFGKDEMQKYSKIVEKHRGPVSYLSLQGTKDLILDSTKKPLPLLHAQFGPCATDKPTHNTPQEGFTHMFPALVGDSLYNDLIEAGCKEAATASIISRGMQECTWEFILTSDI